MIPATVPLMILKYQFSIWNNFVRTILTPLDASIWTRKIIILCLPRWDSQATLYLDNTTDKLEIQNIPTIAIAAVVKFNSE